MALNPIKRVFIIGIDGGTFDVLKPQMLLGNMPTLQQLMARGGHGFLHSTTPPITGPAWRTFATGCNPGKHGVIDFVEFDSQTRTVRVKDVSHVPIPTFWDEVGRQGKRVGIMSVPMTYPPRPVNGFLLTGLMTPSGSKRFTFPPDLASSLEAQGLSFPTSEGESANASNLAAYVEQIVKDMQSRLETARYLLDTHQPDCVVFVVGATDPVQHQFFHLLDDGSGAKADKATAALLGRFYRAVDESIAQLLHFADDETLVIIISDHGFGRLKGFIHLNNWLLEKGYLHLRSDPWTRLRYLAHRLGYTPEKLYRFARWLGLDLRRRMNRGRAYSLTRLAFLSFANVDWPRTQAYALGHIGQVYIQRKPEMSIADYEKLREALRRDLLEMKHPGTGEKLIAQVYRREELYHGPYTELAPDLVLEPHEFGYIAFGESEFASNLIVGPSLHTGHHRLEGILIVHGPGVRQGVCLEDASIADIAPTVLYAMGLAVPPHMDGRPLQAAFTSEFNERNPLRHAAESAVGMSASQEGYTADEERLVRQRLRDLGYTA